MRDEASTLSDLADVTAIDGEYLDDGAVAAPPALDRIRWDNLDDDTFHQILSSWQVAHSIAANYSLRFEDVRADARGQLLEMFPGLNVTAERPPLPPGYALARDSFPSR